MYKPFSFAKFKRLFSETLDYIIKMKFQSSFNSMLAGINCIVFFQSRKSLTFATRRTSSWSITAVPSIPTTTSSQNRKPSSTTTNLLQDQVRPTKQHFFIKSDSLQSKSFNQKLRN